MAMRSTKPRPDGGGPRRVIGNVMEWYDFALYGYFATEIGAQFFHHQIRATHCWLPCGLCG